MQDSNQHDGLKWFGEGFDGFPKRLPDDCVEYIVHVINEDFITSAATRSRLSQILKSADILKKQYLKDYIWQRDGLDLKLYPQVSLNAAEDGSNDNKSDLEQGGRQRLQGRTNYGDSIADEWLIVYLLLELSKTFADAWIRVYDTDGEFLLIEAANALPKWLNPDIAENRVWISNGHLRIIPLDDGTPNRNLSSQAALTFIESNPDKLIISPFIEDEAFYRLRDYPKAIASSLHHSSVSIPRRLASILHRNPAYISPAIEAFYLRDPISLKPLVTKDLATLNFPPENFVTVNCKFTKVGFAQLRSQIFDPPPAWTAVLPRKDDPKVSMGMKLTCGFEMLVADPQNQDKAAVREINILLEDIETGEETLPTDSDLASWPQTQDDEKWLDIDYNDFEAELSGKSGRKADGKGKERGTGFGDPGAQDHLRKMVNRFEDFLNDEDAGADGVDEDGGSSDDGESSGAEDSGEDENAHYDEAEFEKAMKEMMGMSPEFIEESGLLDEARNLAVQDAEDHDQSKEEEDEEMKKVMELMEKELKGHGALNLNDGSKKPVKSEGAKSKSDGVKKPFFGPERPPGMSKQVMNTRSNPEESADKEIGPGEDDLSSDDEEFNDVDLGLAKNMLQSFKGQAGMAGPAGNLMRAMGVNMPRDESSDDD